MCFIVEFFFFGCLYSLVNFWFYCVGLEYFYFMFCLYFLRCFRDILFFFYKGRKRKLVGGIFTLGCEIRKGLRFDMFVYELIVLGWFSFEVLLKKI